MTDLPVLYEKRGKVALITLNRPERMNAVNQSLWDALDAALARYDADEDAWARRGRGAEAGARDRADMTVPAAHEHGGPRNRLAWRLHCGASPWAVSSGGSAGRT